jgi:hypothetical protein
MSGWRAWRDEIKDGTILGPVRIGIGAFLFFHTLMSARELITLGYFGDGFHVPWLPEALVPARSLYVAILAARLVLGALIVTGHRARGALLASAILGFYVLLCDRVQFHHNRYSLLLYAFLLSFTPCDRSLHLFEADPPPAARSGPFWAVHLAQLQVALIYLSSGFSKLLDPDWQSGMVIGDRIHRYADVAIARGVPQGLVSFLGAPGTSSVLAKAAILTELFLAIGLFSKRTRAFALWWGVMFHLTIELTSQVEIFTWLTLTMYGVFVTPDARARKLYFDPSRGKSKWLARVVKLGDWLARFEVKAWAPDDLKKAHSIVVVRRDGTRATGVRALAMIARCIPLFFPLWAPLALIASFTDRNDADSDA